MDRSAFTGTSPFPELEDIDDCGMTMRASHGSRPRVDLAGGLGAHEPASTAFGIVSSLSQYLDVAATRSFRKANFLDGSVSRHGLSQGRRFLAWPHGLPRLSK